MSAVSSGPDRQLGIELYRGSMAYSNTSTARAASTGEKIVIKAYDDAYNPTPAIDNTIRWSRRTTCFLLWNYVGYRNYTLFTASEAAPRSVGIPLLPVQRRPASAQPHGEFVFNLRASYYQETAGLADPRSAPKALWAMHAVTEMGMFEELGTTAEEVASTLRAKGIRGVRNTVRFLNPIVRYVHMQLGNPVLQIDVTSGATLCIVHPDGSKEESRLPDAIKRVLDAFNRGLFPDLETDH